MSSQVVLVKRNLPSNEEDVRDVGSLGWENPLGEGMATPFSILAWRSPWKQRSLATYSPQSYRVRHNRSDLRHKYLSAAEDPVHMLG